MASRFVTVKCPVKVNFQTTFAKKSSSSTLKIAIVSIPGHVKWSAADVCAGLVVVFHQLGNGHHPLLFLHLKFGDAVLHIFQNLEEGKVRSLTQLCIFHFAIKDALKSRASDKLSGVIHNTSSRKRGY